MIGTLLTRFVGPRCLTTTTTTTGVARIVACSTSSAACVSPVLGGRRQQRTISDSTLLDLGSEDRQVLFHVDGGPLFSQQQQRQNLADSDADSDADADGEMSRGPPPGIATITLNRPGAANALGTVLMRQLREALDAVRSAGPADVRCLVITSSSPKVFCAGADLKERATMTQEEAGEFVGTLRGTMSDIADLPMPVLAAVEGVALGGGLEMALAADLRVAGSSAVFGLVETSLAIIPGAGGTQRLPRIIGRARAKELIFTARKIDAQTALDYGLVEHRVREGEANAKALFIAQEIARNGPLAIRAAKRAVSDGLEVPEMASSMQIEHDCYASIIPTADRLEGLAAFRERRRPMYRGE